jgi:hypothetical protein
MWPTMAGGRRLMGGWLFEPIQKWYMSPMRYRGLGAREEVVLVGQMRTGREMDLSILYLDRRCSG